MLHSLGHVHTRNPCIHRPHQQLHQGVIRVPTKLHTPTHSSSVTRNRAAASLVVACRSVKRPGSQPSGNSSSDDEDADSSAQHTSNKQPSKGPQRPPLPPPLRPQDAEGQRSPTANSNNNKQNASGSSSSSSRSGNSPQHPQTPRGDTPATPHRPLQRPNAGRATGRMKSRSADDRAKLLTVSIKATTDPQALLQVVQQHGANFNHIHLSAAYTAAVRVWRNGNRHTQKQLVTELHQLCASLQQQCGARELANIIWSCGKLQAADTAILLLPVLLQPSSLQQAKPQEASNTVWAVATMGQQLAADELQLLLQRFMRLLPHTNAQDVANLVWAVATMGQQLTVTQLQQLLDRFVQLLPNAVPQAVSNTMWAVATMGQQVPQQQLSAMLQRFTQLLPAAKPQEVSNTLWAVATIRQQVPRQQLSSMLQRFMQLLPDATPQEVSNTLWAVATMGQHVPQQQLLRMLQRFMQVLPGATPQAVANTLWAVATMGQQVPQQQLSVMLQRLTQLVPDATPQAVSNTLLAWGRMQYAPLQLLSALQQQPQQLHSLLTAAKPQHLANMAWACGQLGYGSKQLPAAFLQQAVQLLQIKGVSRFKVQELCTLCWAAAVLDLRDCAQQVLQLAGASDELWQAAVAENLLQLHQVHLWLLDSKLPAPQGQGLSGKLTPQQLGQCKVVWEQQLAANAQKKVTVTQQSVFAASQQLPAGTWQQQPQMEQVIQDGTYSIDIAGVTAAGVRVAMEVDGPTHFIQPGNTLNGGTQCRNRALAARGYAVVSVPFWEWDRLRGGEQQQSYLLAKLQAARAPKAAAAAASGAAAAGGKTSRAAAIAAKAAAAAAIAAPAKRNAKSAPAAVDTESPGWQDLTPSKRRRRVSS